MVQAIRSGGSYQNCSDRYLLKDSDVTGSCFHRQYYHVYSARINALKPRIVEAAKKKYGL